MIEQPRNTSIPLIGLTLVVGIALGWLLRDQFFRPAQPPTETPTQTTINLQTAEPSATAEPGVTSTATLEPTATTEPTLEPSSTPEPTATPVPATITSYSGHRLVAGETLDELALRAGSSADLIRSYNHLDGDPQPGRALIIPQIEEQTNTLNNEPILIERGPTTQPWVALTLDAGADSAPTPDILKTLREHHVTITFFLTGKWIEDNPELTRQIVADGHEIANHTFSHPDLRNLSDAEIVRELDSTESLLQTTAGVNPRPFLRPPYGAYNQHVLEVSETHGYLPIYWTLDSLDSVGEPKTPEFLFERVTGKLPPDQLRGAIILAHCGSRPTADALPRILDRFAEMGFEVKKLSEVLNS